jgi:cytochrome c oxidase cbb3-type subunit 1
MWVAGIMQGLMWRAYTDQGYLEYSFVETVQAMHPMYVIRAMGGGMFVIGMLIMIFNIYKTLSAPATAASADYATKLAPAE